MDRKRWISTAVLAASIAAATCPSAPAQPSAAAPATAPADTPIDPKILVDQDIAALTQALVKPAPAAGAADQATVEQQRDEAAQRLLSRGASGILLDRLTTGPRETKLAIARALADAPSPSPIFINALLPLLGGDKILNDMGARALARFDNAVARKAMLDFAQNPAKPAGLRVGVIRALGNIPDRGVADALVLVAGDVRQGLPVQNAAMDALADLTGQTGNGRSVAKWKQWQAASAGKADAVWHDELMTWRAARAADLLRAKSDTAAELFQILDDQYERGDFPTKTALLMRELNSTDARVREAGVQKFFAEKLNGHPLPAAAPKRLADMVGDSDVAVRILVAQSIKAQNDVNALDAILAQLPQETNQDAKLAQIDALATMKRIRAVPALRNLLHDPSLAISNAAVRALEELAETLIKQDPKLARQVSEELWQIGMQRANEPGGIGFQAATIEAVGILHDHALRKDLLDLLSMDNSEPIRSAALRALGSLGDRATFFGISKWLGNEPSPSVRVNAIAALGSTGTFEDAADILYRYMRTTTEPDAAVRDQAWLQFQSLLDTATNIEVLTRWADEFKNDPARRLQILLVLDRKLQRDMSWDPLAYSRQNTGETYMDAKINDPAKAAIQFELALNYWQEKRIPTPVTTQLMQQLLQALLAAKDYDKAASFGAKQIARDPTQQTIIGPALTNAANLLHDDGLRTNDAQKLRDGVKLSDAILKMQPALAEHYQNDVRQLMQEMQERLKKAPK